MLFQGWSVCSKRVWQGHPFNASNNINGVNGDLNNDGYDDVFLYNASTGAWRKGINDGAGHFQFAAVRIKKQVQLVAGPADVVQMFAEMDDIS